MIRGARLGFAVTEFLGILEGGLVVILVIAVQSLVLFKDGIVVFCVAICLEMGESAKVLIDGLCEG